MREFHAPGQQNSQAVSLAEQEQYVKVMAPWIFLLES